MGLFEGTAFGAMVQQIESMPGENSHEQIANYRRALEEQGESYGVGTPHWGPNLSVIGFLDWFERSLARLEGQSLLAETPSERMAA